jgi:hypothetical protein
MRVGAVYSPRMWDSPEKRTVIRDRVFRILRVAAGNIMIAFLLFALIEGVSSTIYVARQFSGRPIAERRHTRYDPEIGWVNVPGARVINMYGPGRNLTINALGSRGGAVGPEAPHGRIRIVCSGDSFTLGYGVDDEETWSRQLSQLDERMETVNLGQGGYGIDQSWLLYRRLAPRVSHQVHILAFITSDFERMRLDTFSGYGKPVLDLDGAAALRVRNVPVPSASYSRSWLVRNRKAISEFRSVALFRKLAGLSTPSPPAPPERDEARLREIVARVFQDLRRMSEANGSLLVLAYLPTRRDLSGGSADGWRSFVAGSAVPDSVMVIDLVPEVRRLSPGTVDSLFIPEGEMNYAGAAGHYSAEGNRWVAGRIHDRLLAEPRLARLLFGGEQDSGP